MAQVKKEENKNTTAKKETKEKDNTKTNAGQSKENITKSSASKNKNPKTDVKQKREVKPSTDTKSKIKTAKSTNAKTSGETKKETSTKTSRKTTKPEKKSTTSKTTKAASNKKNKGKITKITATKKPEEAVEDDVIITDANENTKEVVKFEDEQKMQVVEEEVKKDLKSKNKLPKEEERKLASIVFENLCVAIAFMLYLFFVILGFINIKNDVYIVDLKVFSFILLIIAIILFERAYKKDSGKICAFGIETLFLSIATMGLLYVNIEVQNMFLTIVSIISLLFAIYYVAKSIYLYSKNKKKYFLDNMKDIMQKEEKE